MQYDANMTFWKRKTYTEGKQSTGCQELVRGKIE